MYKILGYVFSLIKMTSINLQEFDKSLQDTYGRRAQLKGPVRPLSPPTSHTQTFAHKSCKHTHLKTDTRKRRTHELSDTKNTDS